MRELQLVSKSCHSESRSALNISLFTHGLYAVLESHFIVYTVIYMFKRVGRVARVIIANTILLLDFTRVLASAIRPILFSLSNVLSLRFPVRIRYSIALVNNSYTIPIKFKVSNPSDTKNMNQPMFWQSFYGNIRL